ncbi:TetR/AcrR family transcriptional regulator [Prescottella equi]|uniref:TetR/AcrR family transcriptional regulator n=1 Tax=Rhodococcus hoagii TaxID=43767 RepID=UPI000A0F5A95|nr:TetR/AcrR family transcriptional regulator [Prescottella equi]ORL15987.1 TetR family transcriptional regulator [Prescottella equi]
MAPRSTGIDRRFDARTAILAAAESCFARYGIAKTTMEDVAKAASMSRATVYRYFADREALVAESVVRRARARIDAARQFISGWPTIEERLVEGICQDIRRGHLDPMVNRLVSPEEMSLSVQLLNKSGRAVDLTHELWGPVLAEEQKAGNIRRDLDLRLVSEWIAELEIMYISRYGTADEALDRIREKLRTFVVPALVECSCHQTVPAPQPDRLQS